MEVVKIKHHKVAPRLAFIITAMPSGQSTLEIANAIKAILNEHTMLKGIEVKLHLGGIRK